MEEQAEEEGDSRRNDGEAEVCVRARVACVWGGARLRDSPPTPRACMQVVMAHVRRLLRAGVRPQDVGVITPYSAQVARLWELRPEALAGALEISTVDGFQG